MKLPVKDLPALPVWLPAAGESDEYVEIRLNSVLKKSKQYSIRISCDTDYNILLDGKLCGFGRYSDYPQILVWDEYSFENTEANDLTLIFWHSGVDSQTHKAGPAYAVFAFFEDGVLIESSGADTEIRLYAGYHHHRKMIITGQMGAGFACDSVSVPDEFVKAAIQGLSFDTVRPRPNRRLSLGDAIECRVVKNGEFVPCDGADAAERMTACDKARGAGQWYLYDIGREEVGFPEISFDLPECPDIGLVCDFGWGEHIVDGMCRVAIGSRRFTSEFTAGRGSNRFFPALRRLGCRYMQLFIPGKALNVRVIFHPVIYPVDSVKTKLEGLRLRIYDTAVHTLRLCMHEHYEDCPWREQALYTLDSRNQMLAGYKAFKDGNREMVRASLDLISRGERPDGLLMLCYPAGLDLPIPFYTLAYFLQFREYLDFSGDTEFAEEKICFLEKLMQTILSRRIRQGLYAGLCPRYPDSRRIWNFYEWSETMEGKKYKYDEENPPCEAPFNAMLVMALDSLAAIYKYIGQDAQAAAQKELADEVSAAVERVFRLYDGLYRSFTDREDAKLSVLTLALCLLSGSSHGVIPTEKALSIIADNAGFDTIPATLSMACWRYDTLLVFNREKFAPVILSEIDRDCSYMLDRGATTFWETIKGDSDFSNAGSLCHGWSAMSAYYYSILI